MTEHTTVGFADHLCQLTAFWTCDLHRARRHHPGPKIDEQTADYRDGADDEKQIGDDPTNLIAEYDNSPCAKDHSAQAAHREQQTPGSELVDFSRF